MVNMLIAIAAFGALGFAVVAFFRERSLRESLQDARRRLYLAQARLNELESAMQKELQSLRAVVRQHIGSAVFEPTMRIAEAIAIDPRVRDVLAQFHLGGCSSCAINEEHSIAQAALSYSIDVGRLMAALEALQSESQSLQSRPSQSSLLQLSEF
jgi:hybrid cluster-associated redox disulfide protein